MAQSGPAGHQDRCLLVEGFCCKTHLGLPVGWSVDFLSIPYPASDQGSCGIDAYIITPDVTRTLGAPPRTAVGRVRVA